jgi:uncharacterized integral membrane protein
MRYIYGFVLLIFLAAVGIFAVQNMQVYTVGFLGYKLEAPFALLAVGFYLLGMLTGWTVIGFIRSTLHRVRAEPHHSEE